MKDEALIESAKPDLACIRRCINTAAHLVLHLPNFNPTLTCCNLFLFPILILIPTATDLPLTPYRTLISNDQANHPPSPRVKTAQTTGGTLRDASSSRPPTMSSWYSNLLTKTSSQISNLRSTLLSSEADGDTDDDTHVCRVLRNYYSEKGRPFPPWLPPDPRAPAQAPVQPLYAQAGPRMASPQQQQQQLGGGGGGGLSSLWDNNAGAGQQQQAVPQSLRAGGGRGMVQRPGGGSGSMDGRPGTGQSGGSHQVPSRESTPSGGASAQERLRQRLWGGARTTSPNQGGQTPFQPPPAASTGSRGGGGNYEDRFAPGGSYDAGRGGRGGGAEPAPWAGGGDDLYYGGGGGGGPPAPPSGGVRRAGLPSGPRAYR